ncbi:protein twist-like [Hydractinia symbiolongicarpus]|uniref:protein twist-like n=1 Tax=Hydractinia symbiolongicarpus TaxID=13093 RepID=UPI00254D951D|nr:protein twist-like [Hydractinia symbiolongicarpus]
MQILSQNNHEEKYQQKFNSKHFKIKKADGVGSMKKRKRNQAKQILSGSKTKTKSTPTHHAQSEKQILRNERERQRKARLNFAFKILKQTVNNISHKRTKHLTQLEILKLATVYISNLADVLEKEQLGAL